MPEITTAIKLLTSNYYFVGSHLAHAGAVLSEAVRQCIDLCREKRTGEIFSGIRAFTKSLESSGEWTATELRASGLRHGDAGPLREAGKQVPHVFYGLLAATRRVGPQGPKAYQTPMTEWRVDSRRNSLLPHSLLPHSARPHPALPQPICGCGLQLAVNASLRTHT
jgi:hypothetical protein